MSFRDWIQSFSTQRVEPDIQTWINRYYVRGGLPTDPVDLAMAREFNDIDRRLKKIESGAYE